MARIAKGVTLDNTAVNCAVIIIVVITSPGPPINPDYTHSAMIRVSYRRLLTTAFLFLAPLSYGLAQLAYQSPPPDLLKILEAPANPATSVSPNRQWVLVTVSDPRSITISDMADSAYYLGGSKIRANPDYRVENIGVRTTQIRTVDNVQVLVPNATVFSEVVANHTYERPAMADATAAERRQPARDLDGQPSRAESPGKPRVGT